MKPASEFELHALLQSLMQSHKLLSFHGMLKAADEVSDAVVAAVETQVERVASAAREEQTKQ